MTEAELLRIPAVWWRVFSAEWAAIGVCALISAREAATDDVSRARYSRGIDDELVRWGGDGDDLADIMRVALTTALASAPGVTVPWPSKERCPA